MVFKNELEFENAVVSLLIENGWKDGIIKNPTEDKLLENWANILFSNNNSKDKLNNQPLTKGEMGQILEQIKVLETPLKLNGFINGKTVTIKRDNPADELHFGKEISLDIYDRNEIAGGRSRYQIAEQPIFYAKRDILQDRRGDLTLLINGMPVIHIELKKQGVPLSDANFQIKKYSKEGHFSGLYSLVQVFVVMKPDESLYFANPGKDGKFDPNYYFHWADFSNEPVNKWTDVISQLLSIPMAHQMIGYYTVADNSDGVLKVMRSYQYYAASKISDRVSKLKNETKKQLGGYIWHTTGSGKTLTSFKSAQLIANSGDADKVVFLVDRIELGTQSLQEYRGFAGDRNDVQETEDTVVLINKLKSADPKNTLIVTSIQKMSNIKSGEQFVSDVDIRALQKKRVVFIIDECHRSSFGEMLLTIKTTFPEATFFGFTGTPILEENKKKDSYTAIVFGDELHRYSIADGIRDKNVLGFDPYRVSTFSDQALRKAVALYKAKATTEDEAVSDKAKSKIYFDYTDSSKYSMIDIESYVPTAQYRESEHQEKVVENIKENWTTLSRNGKFHAIFATSSIPEAIEYYRLIKERIPEIKISALFDKSIDNVDGFDFKEDGLVEIITDYNEMFGQSFSIPTFDNMKKDIANRLSHKAPYLNMAKHKEWQLDLLIVVNQMLTGFDSKWVNTLYLDKVIVYQDIIQAFSRTNRLCGEEKPFGTIKYYRKPYTMEKNIEAAIKLYSGDKPFGIFTDRLEKNIKKLNNTFSELSDLFSSSGIENFEHLPSDSAECGQFVKLFNELNKYIQAARVQGLKWGDNTITQDDGTDKIVTLSFSENDYNSLLQRYKELSSKDSAAGKDSPIPYDLQGYLMDINTGKIDNDYMNSRFEKYRKALTIPGVTEEEKERELKELHKTFATLTQEEQKYANIFLHDVQSGSITLDDNKTLRDYIDEYVYSGKQTQIKNFSEQLGLDETKLAKIMEKSYSGTYYNDFNQSEFEELMGTMVTEKAISYFSEKEGKKLKIFQVKPRAITYVRKFIDEGGFDIEE